MSPDHLADALPVLRTRIEHGETRFSASGRARILAVLDHVMMALDATGPFTPENQLRLDVRDGIRDTMGILFTFELLPGCIYEEDALLRSLEKYVAGLPEYIASRRASAA